MSLIKEKALKDLEHIDEEHRLPIINIFLLQYDERYWEEFVSAIQVFKYEYQYKQFLLDDWVEVMCVPQNVEWFLDEEKIVNEQLMQHSVEEFICEDGFTYYLVWRCF